MDEYYRVWATRIMENGSAVYEGASVSTWWLKEEYGIEAKFHRSKDKKDLTRSPFASYMINKKWTLQEEFTNHLLIFQQVTEECEFLLFHYILTFQAGYTIIENGWNEEEEDDDPVPLRMEHFYFPLGMWLVGILLSAIFLLAEIITHRLRKPKTDVAIAKVEEPSVVLKTKGAELDLAVSENI